MSQNWKPIWIVAAVAVGVIGAFVWKRMKRSFVKVGTVSKLYFHPVKSLKAIEVTKGKCTKLGFEVDGLLDRSFMVINDRGVLVSQRESPSLALLDVQICGKTLVITTPTHKQLKVEIKDSLSLNDKIIECRIHVDGTYGVDCGDEAANFFQTYLNMPGVRLVRHIPTLPKRKYLNNHPFMSKLRKENPIGFQDLAPIHVLSNSSVSDLNSRLQEKEVSELNFRPNVVVDGCKPYAEDSWKYIKFENKVLLSNLQMVTRCVMTTIDLATGVLSKQEPLVTMRKYRIPNDPETVKNIGPLPCFGIGCGVWKTGEISVGEDVFADVGSQPAMRVK